MLNEKELEEVLMKRKDAIKNYSAVDKAELKAEIKEKLKNKNDLLAYADLIEKINDPELILFFSYTYRKMMKPNQANKIFIPMLVKITKGDFDHGKYEELYAIGEENHAFDEITDEMLKLNDVNRVYDWIVFLHVKSGSLYIDDKLIEFIFKQCSADVFYDLAQMIPASKLFKYASTIIKNFLNQSINVSAFIISPLTMLAQAGRDGGCSCDTTVLTTDFVFKICNLMITQNRFNILPTLLSLKILYKDFISYDDVFEFIMHHCTDARLCMKFIDCCKYNHNYENGSDMEKYIPSLIPRFAELCVKQHDTKAMKLILDYCENYDSKGDNQTLKCFDEAMKNLRSVNPGIYIKYISDYRLNDKEVNFEREILEQGSIKEVNILAKCRRRKGNKFNIEEYLKRIIVKLTNLYSEDSNDLNATNSELDSAFDFISSLTDDKKEMDSLDQLPEIAYNYMYDINPEFLTRKIARKLAPYFKSPTLYIDYLVEASEDPKYKLMLQIFYEKLYTAEQENKDITFEEICELVSELLDTERNVTPERNGNPILKITNS